MTWNTLSANENWLEWEPHKYPMDEQALGVGWIEHPGDGKPEVWMDVNAYVFMAQTDV